MVVEMNFCEQYSDGVSFSDEWLSCGLPHWLPQLTKQNIESSTNRPRYGTEQQIIRRDRLLTNDRNFHEDNSTVFSRKSKVPSAIKPVIRRIRKAQAYGRAADFGCGVDMDRGQTDRFTSVPNGDSKRLSPVAEMKVTNAIKKKTVTFDPRHLKSGSNSGSVTSISSQDESSTFGDSNSTLSKNSETCHFQRASSEPKLSENSYFHRSSSERYRRGNSVKMSTTKLHRSFSDRTLAASGTAVFSSNEISPKRKKRSLIQRNIRKIHKVFRKKRSTLLEESEETHDHRQGSDDFVDGAAENNFAEVNGALTIPEDSLDTTTLTRSHSLPKPRKTKLSPSSRSYSPHHDSDTSLNFNTLSQGEGGAFPRLKSNSTSPSALSSLEGSGYGIPSDDSSRLTPTHSNFDDSQLIGPSMGISYHPHSHTLKIQQSERMGKSSTSSYSKNGSFRKKKRSGSWYNVLSPSYKQKNEDFHKFFKDLPATERLLVDYACALVKDILVQGRLYVSQNYVCFHSTILKWQTAVTVNLVDIDQMTKEKTVKVIPNAIQILLKDKAKITFTSFTARDRAYLAIFRLWQNALLDKPMSANELWSQIHRNYGEELGGCSSDDDYVRPKRLPKKHQGIGDDNELTYEFGTTNKVKRSSNAAETLKDGDCDRSIKSQSSSRDSPIKERQGNGSTGDDKSSHSSRDTGEDLPLAENTVELDETDSVKPEQLQGSGLIVEPMEVRNEEPEESDNESADFLMHNLPKHAFTRTYNTSVRNMYRIIFSDDCPFWKQTLVNKGTTGITFGTWKKDDSTPTQHVRELSYTLRLDNSFGPKTSFVKETQTYYLCSVEGKSYVVDCIAQNYGIPYADYFFTAMRYCIRKVARNSCELRVTWELKYKKSPWGLVKNFIEKNVNSGMSENFKKLQKQLQDQIDLEKSESQLYDNRSSAKSSSVRRRKRKSTSSTANTSQSKTKSSSEAPRNEDGRDLSVSEVESSRKRASSSVVAGVPPIYTPNGFIPNEVRTHESEAPKLHYFGQGGKFIFGAILFLFILLLYSNYNMSQRLNTLEQVTAAAATADGVDPAVTAALLDRPGVPITSNPEILSSYLQAIDKRLRRLEDAVIKFTEESNSKWERIEKRWETIEALVKHLSKSSVSQSP